MTRKPRAKLTAQRVEETWSRKNFFFAMRSSYAIYDIGKGAPGKIINLNGSLGF